ncbi:nitroreductase family protein [Salipiger mucosus]|uniref:Putative NAD(P)H nitroreductase n=1 Tax=Salipiger mucosus DSM 16094 TaxID=1123237 RepID=S9QJN9_9RHOB|nr:nitroreductase [Salipiger mucosus]EPX79813.1 Nitroreductase family protein [Salipiger mucosus DSM 16094]
MPARNPEALDFLLSRRSRPAKTLSSPAPDRDALHELLTAAARTPDHGKMEPWRFIVFERPALERLAGEVAGRTAAQAMDADSAAKARRQFDESPLCVAVIESQRESPKIPPIEQTYSAGAVCLSLLNAALAAGWGGNWLSGWAAHDRAFGEEVLGLRPTERVVGFVHIGTETIAPPERPRPDLDAIVEWVET